MKKTTHSGNDGKVIQFPDLEKRLLEKGQEHLQSEKYQEAISVFQQAVKLDSANNDGFFGLILAYDGAGFAEEAIALAKMMLHEGRGDYFPVMDLYIKLLYQAHKYSEIVIMIESLLEERTIPRERLEHYYSMLDIARQLEEQGEETELVKPAKVEEVEKELHLRDFTEQQDQVMLAAKLSKVNIQPYKKEILSYLRDDSGKKGDVFFKTLLLNVLKEHGVEQAVEIHKFDQTMAVIPRDLVDVNEIAQLQEIITLIASRIEHEDPILYESIRMLIHRQFFLFYPFPLVGPELSVWAAAYHLLGIEYFGNVCIKSDILADYHVEEREFVLADSFIRMIEENSYPNI